MGIRSLIDGLCHFLLNHCIRIAIAMICGELFVQSKLTEFLRKASLGAKFYYNASVDTGLNVRAYWAGQD